MPQRSGSANLPLHGGYVPGWLATRMAVLGRVIVEAIVHEYGRAEVLRRLSHPFWFQSFGAVMGMDWHSSGITTSVIGALKRGLAPVQRELGLYVCGGKGSKGRETPRELDTFGEASGVDAAPLARSSRLVAKIDGAAVQDGFDLYLHAFLVSVDGDWCVVQQGMNAQLREARRYHWRSEGLSGFFDSPHAAIEGRSIGTILNLADARASESRQASLELARAGPEQTVGALRRWREPRGTLPLFPETAPARVAEPTAAPFAEQTLACIAEPCPTREAKLAPLALPEQLPPLSLPHRHDVRASDVKLKRLHAILAAAAERGPQDYAELLLLPGVGARTVEALAFVAEVVHGAPSRFVDPARFSLALGGKDGQPFPVPLTVYDETLRVMRRAVRCARLGSSEELAALRRLDQQVRLLDGFATGPSLRSWVESERARAMEFGGRTVAAPSSCRNAPTRVPADHNL